MQVEIRTLSDDGDDVVVGALRLQDDGKIVAEPDSEFLRGFLAELIYDPRANKVYDAETTPEDFLRNLHRQYSSAYLRATKVSESPEAS